MKTIMLVLVLVAAASAHRGGIGGGIGGVGGGAAGGVGGGAAGGHGGPVGGLFGQQPKNYGPKVFGPGANNQFAFAPNPFQMQRALSIVNKIPGALIFLDVDGQIEITDKFGREADIILPGGFELEL